MNAPRADRTESTDALLKRYRAILDSALDCIITIDSDTRIVEFNNVAEKTFGYRADEALGQRLSDVIVPPELKDAHETGFSRYMATGKSKILDTRIEIPALRKDGTTIDCELAITRIDLEDGPLFTATLRDVTEKKKAEKREALTDLLLNAIRIAQAGFIQGKKPKELFGSLLASLLEITKSEYGFIGERLSKNDGSIFLKTHAITDIAWNKSTKDFYLQNVDSGLEFYNLDTLFGEVLKTGDPLVTNDPQAHPASGGLPPGHPEMRSFLGIPLYYGREFLGMAGLANRPGGYDDELLEFLQPLLNTCGSLINAFRNDKAREVAESSLRESGQMIQAMLDSMLDALVVFDQEGRIRKLNNAAQSMFRINDDRELYVASLLPSLRQFRAGDSGKLPLQSVSEIQATRANHSQFPAEVSLSKIDEIDETLYIATVRDVTERKAVENLKREFVSRVSHELRTPLTAIKGTLDLFSAGILGELESDALSTVNIAQRNAEHLRLLLNDILDLEKFQHGTMPLEWESQSLSHLLRGAMETLSSLADVADVGITLMDVDYKVVVDAARMKQVFINLLSNAVKFSPPGEIVEVNAHQEDETLVVSIADRGCGIPEHALETIFEPFHQVDGSDSRKFEGTGLGLAITREIVNAHGGSIRVASTPGEGSTFTLTLKLKGDKP